MTAGGALGAGAAVLGVLAASDLLAGVPGALRRGLAAVGPEGALPRALAPFRAGRALSRVEHRRVVALLAVALLAGGALVAGPIPALAAAATAPLLAGRSRAAVRRRRQARLGAAAPAVARAVADALAGGHSIRGALSAAAREGGLTGPAADELRAAAAALALGQETAAVLERLRERADHPGFDALVAAVLLQRESGGDLAALLRTLATTLEDQIRVEADARAMTAQARFTAVLVAALPAFAAGIAELASPGYLVTLLSRPLTAWLAVLSIVLQAAAWIAVRRIARVRS